MQSKPSIVFATIALGALTFACSQGGGGSITLPASGASDSVTKQQTSGVSTSTDDPSGGDPSSTDTSTNSGPAPVPVADALKSCGVDMTNAGTSLYSEKMYGFAKTYTGTTPLPIIGTIQYTVVATAIVNLAATVGTTTMTTDFNVQATPSLAMDTAKAQVQPNKGTLEADAMDFTSFTQLMQSNPQWATVVCTIQPVKSIAVKRGGHNFTVNFSPPLPMYLMPKADASRYQAEIGSGLNFTNITATIANSDDPNAPSGLALLGTVSVAPTDATITLSAGGETAGTIKGDFAYVFKMNFGVGPGDVARLGLNPTQAFVVNKGDGSFKAIVADTGNAAIGTIILAPDLPSAQPND